MDFFLATLFSLFSIVDPPGAVPVYVALTSDRPLFKVFGPGGLNAIARIMGFIVVAIGVQLIVDGVVHLVSAMK